MKCKIDLVNPILNEKKKCKTLTYDFQEITPQGYMDMEKFLDISDADFMMNPTWLMGVTMAAIIAVNSNIEFIDLMRIKGSDVITMSKLGRNFTWLAEEGLPAKTSDDVQENMQDTSAQA